jgi:hypothetical protein
MDFHELRIGNLVQYGDTIVQVSSVYAVRELIEVQKKDGVGIMSIPFEGVKPVSLSPTVLCHHFNFDEDACLPIELRDAKCYLKLHNGYIALLNNKSESLIHFWDVRYVHQLQNLYYALKGTDMQPSNVAY